MAQFVFPGAFPFPNCIIDEGGRELTDFQTEATLAQIMECYWLVKTWKVTATMSLGVVFEQTYPNWPFVDQGLPESERDLICGYSNEELGITGLIGATFSGGAELTSGEVPTCDNRPAYYESAGLLGGFFGGGFLVPFAGAGFSGNKYYMPLYLELAGGSNTLKSDCTFSSTPGNAFTRGGSSGGGLKSSFPIILKDSVIDVVTWWYPEYVDGQLANQDPSGFFKIEAVDYWPYNP